MDAFIICEENRVAHFNGVFVIIEGEYRVGMNET
jgi:hypothetical protein